MAPSQGQQYAGHQIAGMCPALKGYKDIFIVLSKHVLRKVVIHQYEPAAEANLTPDQTANYKALVRERDQLAVE